MNFLTALAFGCTCESISYSDVRSVLTYRYRISDDFLAEAAAMSLIPVNNKPALIGYYLGFAALIPLCGCAFGVPAIILGVMGILKAGQLNGEGRVHAIVALVLGFGSIVFYGLLDLLILIGMANS